MGEKTLQIILLITLLIAATCLPGYAWNRHGGGVWFVGPRWVAPYPYQYPYPYYYYTLPPQIVIQHQPDVYIQQTPAPVPEQTYWYYCPAPQGYYPYVKECPVGWLKVVPTPPDNTQVQPQRPQK